MTKRTRTTLFIFFVFLFLLAAPSVVFYSQGYRVDFGQKKVVQTGGLYFKVSPGKADVYLNGKLEKTTSIITNSAYLENLLPQKYEIEIKKEGFYPWKKNLKVQEKEITEAKNIALFPKSPQFSVIDKFFPKISPLATSTDKNKIVESDGYEIWVAFLEKDEKVFLTRFSEKVDNIFWLNDYYLAFSVGDKIKIAEIDARDALNIIDLAEFKEPKIAWDYSSKKLYVLSEKKVYLLENLLP